MAFSFGRRGSGSSGGGGGDQTLANIPGTLGTTKGGTGINADDLDALKTGLGIGAQVDPERLGLTEGASEAGKTVKLNSTGDGLRRRDRDGRRRCSRCRERDRRIAARARRDGHERRQPCCAAIHSGDRHEFG